jgi:SAM-dependent methyltransferase
LPVAIFHARSIAEARAHAQAQGVSANARFEVGLAKDYAGRAYDLVTCFDGLHDMGDPAGAAAHIRKSLKPDGTWMIVEPIAGNRPEKNLNPVGRLYDAASTMVCVPILLAEVGAARSSSRRVPLARGHCQGWFPQRAPCGRIPFNMVLEARL